MEIQQRRDQILAAVDRMIDIHEKWVDDDEAPNLPTEAVADAIDHAVVACARGDIPADCRRLTASMGAFAERWAAYKTGDETDGRDGPTRDCWRAFEEVVVQRKGAVVRPPRVYESVRQLRDQKVSDAQIALIYKGLFHDSHGRVRSDLIDLEFATPGAIVPKDWIHPDELARVAEETAALDGQIATLRRHGEATVIDKASVEELLREGAFPEQVARVKGITLDDVLEIARRNEIRPNEMPNLAASRGPYDPELTPERALSAQPLTPSTPPEAVDDDGGDTLEDAVDTVLGDNRTAGAAEIASQASELLGRPVSAREVNRVLKARGGRA